MGRNARCKFSHSIVKISEKRDLKVLGKGKVVGAEGRRKEVANFDEQQKISTAPAFLVQLRISTAVVKCQHFSELAIVQQFVNTRV